MRTYIKPFANWIWLGAMIMAVGGVVSLTDRRYRVGAPRAAAAPRRGRPIAAGMDRDGRPRLPPSSVPSILGGELAEGREGAQAPSPAAIILALALLAPAAHAVQPDEILPDPALEARARAISSELRCVVCQSESIDDSNADIARDLRLLVRERIVAGDTDEQVQDFVVDRYGEFVLFRPPFTARNATLWLAGPVLLLAGGTIAFAFIRRRAVSPAAARPPLTPEEESRLSEITRG